MQLCMQKAYSLYLLILLFYTMNLLYIISQIVFFKKVSEHFIQLLNYFTTPLFIELCVYDLELLLYSLQPCVLQSTKILLLPSKCEIIFVTL